MSAPLVAVSNLSVAYRAPSAPALEGIDLEIGVGERLAIIGESGSGKSTLALAIAGLLPGTASVTGRIDWPALGRPPAPGLDFGVVFQDPGSSLNPVLTIGEQVAEGARRHLGMGRAGGRAHALELLARMRIPEPESALSAFPHQFSGGQRQRIAIAAAIAARPRLLIADEATSALDMIVQAEIATLLDTLVREEGMTLLFVTHDIALAAGLADRIAVFRDALLVESGPARSLVDAPADPYTKRLIDTHIDLAAPPLIAGAAP